MLPKLHIVQCTKLSNQVISVEHWKGLVANNQSQPDSAESFKVLFFLHWHILMNEDCDDSLTNILKEEEQQQLQQVGGHGAQDKAQAMQVNPTT